MLVRLYLAFNSSSRGREFIHAVNLFSVPYGNLLQGRLCVFSCFSAHKCQMSSRGGGEKRVPSEKGEPVYHAIQTKSEIKLKMVDVTTT